MTTPPMPPARPPYKDRPLIVSIAMTILSAIAAVHGIPIGDPGLTQLMDLVVQGLLGLSGLATAVRAIALRKDRP